jgi:hypothetical protein
MVNRENIKLALNSKLLVRVEDTNAKECTSRYHDGKEYRYAVIRCENGAPGWLYLPVDAHIAIRRANVSPGDDVELLKTMRMGVPQFGVTIVGDASSAAFDALPASPETARPQALPTPAVQTQRSPAVQPYNRGAVAVAAQPAPADGANTALGKRCFRAAVDVLAEARQYAIDTYQWDLEVNAEDVRALGISFLIGEQRGGR